MSSVPTSKRAKSSEPPRKTSAASSSSRPEDAQRRPSSRSSGEVAAGSRRRSTDQAPNKSPNPAAGDWSQAVLQFMRNLFVRQVSLQRKGGDLHVVLRERDSSASGHGAASAHSAPMPLPSNGEAKPTHATLLGISSNQLKRMRHQLSAVLDLHPATRSVFPHLNYLDKSMRRHGADCFRDLPVEVLHKALKQLDSLVQSAHPGPAGLAELRACLVVSAVDRGGVETDPDAQALALGTDSSGLPSHLSDFNLTSKLSVHEVSHSDFEQAHQQWESVGETVKLGKT